MAKTDFVSCGDLVVRFTIAHQDNDKGHDQTIDDGKDGYLLFTIHSQCQPTQRSKPHSAGTRTSQLQRSSSVTSSLASTKEAQLGSLTSTRFSTTQLASIIHWLKSHSTHTLSLLPNGSRSTRKTDPDLRQRHFGDSAVYTNRHHLTNVPPTWRTHSTRKRKTKTLPFTETTRTILPWEA